MYAIEVGIVLIIIAVLIFWLLMARVFSKFGGFIQNLFIKPFKQPEQKVEKDT